jgi:hypothetical protein
MRKLLRSVAVAAAWLFVAASPIAAQDFRGRINGTVTDNTGAVLPGVTVTASSPALIQPQVQVTGADGSYRFLALPAGTYDVAFELIGFQHVKREGIRVVINQTLTVDQQLQVATLQETVTVTGQSPIVDTSTNTLATNFTKELLTEIPNARDIWAAMSQAPGLQMTAYDVGGSNTGTQTGYITYGFSGQNQTRLEGIDTTEGRDANAGYFDFGSFEEFQVGGAGSDSSTFATGAVLSISVKSGADRFTGDWYSDWLGDATVSDNVPDNLRASRQTDDDGFYVRTPLTRGNPVDRQFDINWNAGGPIVKQKAWFFVSWRLNDQYKHVLNSDLIERSKLSNKYTFKGTFQVGRNNQLIGFLNKREKLQDKRNLGPSRPISAAQYQSSRNYPWKAEWTSVLGGRAFLDVLYGNWYNFFPLRPTRDFDLYDGPWGPGRIDTATNIYFDGGGADSYQDQKRYKPQFYVTMNYFKDGWKGSHDLRTGYDWKRDRRNFFQDQPFDIFYRDNGGQTRELELYNTPTSPINDVVYHSFWLQDTWKATNRLTLNLGLRIESYRDGWPEQEFQPNGHPQLANWNDAQYRQFVAPVTVDARTVSDSLTAAPRVGFAYDLTGDNRTVLKMHFGQTRFNSADLLADQENPVGRARLRYVFNDLNGNRLLDGPQELGNFLQTVGGGGFVRVDRDLVRPTGNEFGTNVEREIVPGLSGRLSYVYKNARNVWGEVDVARLPTYVVPFTFVDPGPDNAANTGDETTFRTFDRTASADSDRVYTNPDLNNDDYHTVEIALNRRFSSGWMVLTSFGHTWRYTGSDAYRPADRLWLDENGQEQRTLWNYKLIGRYTLPFDIGLSGSWKLQSGEQWGRTVSVRFPNDGTRTVRVEPLNANRAPSVSIIDFRFDKSFRYRGTRLTAMVDIFNAANYGTVTDYRDTTVNYQEVTEILDPRVVRFGVRFNF